MLKPNEVREQSENAERQWGPTWEKHAKKNGELYAKLGRKYPEHLLFKGTGKTAVCCAYGPSFGYQLKTLAKYKDNVEVICVDKCLGKLLDNGIIPKYVLICDAGIDYAKWCKPWIDKVHGINLIANVTANPEWTENWHKNGGEVWFSVNKDNIQTELKYGPLSGCKELVPASSNVGNSVVVFSVLTFNYDRYLLIGYDFSWATYDPYYCLDEDSDKRYWMRHADTVTPFGVFSHTSQNLLFSSKWLGDYYIAELRPRNISVFNCSGAGILANIPKANFEYCLQMSKTRSLTEEDKQRILDAYIKEEIINASPEAGVELNKALTGRNVSQVAVRYVSNEVLQWIKERSDIQAQEKGFSHG